MTFCFLRIFLYRQQTVFLKMIIVKMFQRKSSTLQYYLFTYILLNRVFKWSRPILSLIHESWLSYRRGISSKPSDNDIKLLNYLIILTVQFLPCSGTSNSPCLVRPSWNSSSVTTRPKIILKETITSADFKPVQHSSPG